jgi:hypothetical protein
MIPPSGDYRYELMSGGQVVAVEEARLTADRLTGARVSQSGRYDVEATLAPDSSVSSLSIRYVRGPFSRAASYRAETDLLRGSVGALAGQNATETKLGRLREVDADLILFKALIIGHARLRGQTRFTGRIATIDPNTLVASSPKQTYRQRDASGLRWLYEPRMGESEQIELDDQGRIVRRIDRRGAETVLRSFRAI